MEPESDEDSDLPNLETASVSDVKYEGGYRADSKDWFSEVGEDMADDGDDAEELFGTNWSECISLTNASPDLDAAVSNEIAAMHKIPMHLMLKSMILVAPSILHCIKMLSKISLRFLPNSSMLQISKQ